MGDFPYFFFFCIKIILAVFENISQVKLKKKNQNWQWQYVCTYPAGQNTKWEKWWMSGTHVSLSWCLIFSKTRGWVGLSTDKMSCSITVIRHRVCVCLPARWPPARPKPNWCTPVSRGRQLKGLRTRCTPSSPRTPFEPATPQPLGHLTRSQVPTSTIFYLRPSVKHLQDYPHLGHRESTPPPISITPSTYCLKAFGLKVKKKSL